MKINRYSLKAKENPCGLLAKLYESENISISYVTIKGEARKHIHKQIEEVYYVAKGKGQIIIDNVTLDIEEGDMVPISKGSSHQLKQVGDDILEVLVITHPKYISQDLILVK